MSGGYPVDFTGVHGHRYIANGLCFVDGERKLIAINSGIDVVGRRETNPRCVDEEAVVAEMVVCVRNADVQENPTEQLLTVGQGVGTYGLEKLDQLKVARPSFSVFSLRESHCRDKGDTTTLRSAVKFLDEKRRERTLLETKCSGIGNLNARLSRK